MATAHKIEKGVGMDTGADTVVAIGVEKLRMVRSVKRKRLLNDFLLKRAVLVCYQDLLSAVVVANCL